VAAPLMIQASFDMGAAIIAAAGLSFIGSARSRQRRSGA
jgi:ABC-type dipeptide/oligopeptide/nickel transport system permease subunit